MGSGDLNLALDFFDHPKQKRLVGILGEGAEILTVRLWCYVGKYYPETGELPGHTSQEVESICGWWGSKGEAVRALLKVRVLEKFGDIFKVHDWLEHQSHIAVFKARGKALAHLRWNNRNAVRIAESNAARIAPCNALTNQPTNPPTIHPTGGGGN